MAAKGIDEMSILESVKKLYTPKAWLGARDFRQQCIGHVLRQMFRSPTNLPFCPFGYASTNL
jgi:hypothetical protein